jgi:hypothetical protein
VRLLKQDLDRCGVLSKRRTSKGGVESGGHSFSRGALYARCSRTRFMSVKSATRAFVILVSTSRSWIAQCGSEHSSCCVSTE